jgi:hypothetical protein
MIRMIGEYYAPSILLSKSEFEEIQACAGAMEELSQLMQPPYPYIALRVISGKLLDLIEAVDYRQVVRQ